MIFVTGGAGFIGANFVLDWLAAGGEPVLVIDKLTYAGRIENLDAVRAAMLALDERTDAELLRLDMLHMATDCGANALMERVVALADEAQPATRPMTAEDGWPTLAWAFVDACDRFRQVQASNAKLMERAAGECARCAECSPAP